MMAHGMGLGLSRAGDYLRSPAAIVSLCSSVGVQMSFYDITQQSRIMFIEY